MELNDYARVVRRSWLLIIVLAVLGLVLGATYQTIKPRTYETTAEAFVSLSAAGSVSDLNQGVSTAQQLVKTYANVADSEYVLQPVIDALHLDTTPAALATHVTATAPLDTVEVDVTVSYSSAALSSQIANAITDRLSTAVTSLSSDATTAPSVKITRIQPAPVPTQPSGPSLPTTLAIAAALGLLAGLVIGYVRERLDTRVRSVEGLDEQYGTPLLGATPVDPRVAVKHIGIAAGRKSAPYVEAVRALGVNLEFLKIPKGSRSFVITSATEAEGKSTTAVNLAVLLADSGQRVLLIDGDLRRPNIAAYLGLDGGLGLTDVLVGRVPRDEAVQRWGDLDLDLDVLVAGSRAPNPSQLVQSVELEQLIRESEAAYDIVIVDAPPVLAVSDAAVLARRAAGALVVAGVDKVRHPQLRAAIAAIKQIDAVCLGIVATMVPGGRLAGDGYYYDESADSDRGTTARSRETEPTAEDTVQRDVAPSFEDALMRSAAHHGHAGRRVVFRRTRDARST